MHFDPSEFIKRFQPQSALALTIGSDQLTASLVRLDSQSGKVTPSIPVFKLPLGADAILKNPASAGAELATALVAAGVREKRYVVCIPPEWAQTASADLPEVSPEDLRDYFELRAEREFSAPASDFRLASSTFELPDGKKRATLAAVHPRKIEAVEEMLQAAGGQALSISLGLDGCLSGPTPRLHLVTAEAKTVLVVSLGGGIAAVRNLPGPSGHAESAFDPAAFLREVRITLGRLPDPVRQLLKLGTIHGSQAETLHRLLGEGLERIGINCTPSILSSAASPAIEAATRFLLHQSVGFEFVTIEPNPWQTALERFNNQRGRQIAMGAVALIFLPLLVFLVRMHRESSLQSEWEGMRSSVASLEIIQQKIRQFRPWFESTPQNLQILQTLIGAFPEKGEVWTKSVQIKGGAGASQGTKIICSGYARNQAAVMALMDRLLKTPGVTALSQRTLGSNPVQFTATYVWKPQNDQ